MILYLMPVETLIMNFGEWKAFRIMAALTDLLEFLIGVISTMAIAYVIRCRLDKKKVDLKSALRKSILRWPAALGTNLLLGILLIGLFILLIVPGIIFSIYWIFTTYVVILNKKSGKGALDYSKGIVKGRWWKVVGYNIVFFIFGFLFIAVVSVPFFLLPLNFFIDFTKGILIDIIASYFLVVYTIFFINFDDTKQKIAKKS